MSCPCGSTKCVCQEACFCPDNSCQCRKCQLLEKICPQCNLPFYVITLKEDYERQVCSCDKKRDAAYYSEARSHLQTGACAMSDRSSISPARGDHCPRCNLPILFVSVDEDFEDKVRYCCCSHRNLSTDNPDMSTEHETSAGTSDHREVSADRQVRKALSRKTRTEKSKWQAKKAKERSSNSFEESSFTETVDADEILAESSCPASLEEQDPSSAGLSEGFMEGIGNMNTDSNTQSQRGHSSRAGDASLGNVSLEVNTSGISSPSTSKLSEGGERMSKWFETLEDAMNTSGELPDAETAAALDKEDKERLKEEPSDKGEEQSEEEPGGRPEGQSQNNSKDEDDIDPTTDTERSSSKSPKESESD